VTPEKVLFICTHNSARSQLARDELRNRIRMLMLTAGREELEHPVAERIPEQHA
jgi:protein-tyrosine-phosphatase